MRCHSWNECRPDCWLLVVGKNPLDKVHMRWISCFQQGIKGHSQRHMGFQWHPQIVDKVAGVIWQSFDVNTKASLMAWLLLACLLPFVLTDRFRRNSWYHVDHLEGLVIQLVFCVYEVDQNGTSHKRFGSHFQLGLPGFLTSLRQSPFRFTHAVCWTRENKRIG